MHKPNYTFVIFSIFFSNIVAQTTVEEYELEKASLSERKIELQGEISDLKSEIDKMHNLITELEQEVTTAYRELYVLKYGEEFGQRVAYNQVWKGMSEEMMDDSWGEPDSVDSNVQSYGVFNQWYYGDVTFFFRDGKLFDWDEAGTTNDENSLYYLNKRK